MGDNSSRRTSGRRPVNSAMSDLSSTLDTSEPLAEMESQRTSHSYVNNAANFSETEFGNNIRNDYDEELKENLSNSPVLKTPPPDYSINNDDDFRVEVKSMESAIESNDHANRVHQSSDDVVQSQPDLQKHYPKPNKFCVLLVRYPKTAFAITLVSHLLVVVITVILMRVGYNILPIEFAQLPLQIQWDEDFLHGMAWNQRNDDSTIIDRTVLGNGLQTERSVRSDIIQLFYEETGGNVFTKDNLKKIKEVEDEIFTNAGFEKHCLLFNGKCAKPMSILRYFDGTFPFSPVFNDPDFDNIATVLYTANNNDLLKKQLQMFLGNDHTITATTARSPITRTFMYLAGPLDGYSNITDRKDDQEKLLKDMMSKEILPICQKYYKNGLGTMAFFYNSGQLFSAMITKQAMMDMLLAAASLCFIFLFMLIQTGSLWITCFSLLSILTCFCCANLIYRIVFDFIYFGMFHILAVFIILGIGADDIFVFLDTWKNSAHHRYPSLEHRLSAVYNKAAAAMLFTSLTTAIAFMVSGLSPLLAVNSFGIFSSILVIVNYLSVIIYLPAVVVNYHLSWEKWIWPCCRPCKREPSSTVGVTGSPASTTRKHPVVRFFAGPFFRFITNKIAKWIVVVICLGLVACFSYYASQLVPQEEQLKFLKDDSNFGKALDRSGNAFAPSTQDRNVKVYLVWGLKKQDRSSCHKTDYRCTGKTVWDDSFDLNQPPAQKALLDFCEKLKNGLTTEQQKKLHIKEDIVSKKLEVDCFIEHMNDFLQREQKITAKYPASTVLTLPMSQAKGTTLMKYNPQIYDISQLSIYFYRHFEEALDYWLYSGYNPKYSRMPQFAAFNKLLGSSLEDGLSLPIKTNKDIMFGTRLRYAAIVVNTSLVSTTLGYPTGLPIRDYWYEFFKSEVAKMPASLRGGFMATPKGFNVWHWLKIQKTLADSAILGIVIGICIALPILIVATGNLLVALYAVVTIICTTVSVVGVIPMAGWKLGLLESLNLVLVVGLAVDYVVHLAEGYSRSKATDRLGRVQSMLEEVGISVLSGACTTLGASMFMFFAEILFFTQFGIFMFSTIGFSILYALFLFTSALAIIGPQGECMAIKPWFVALKNKIIGRSKEAADCDKCSGKGFINPVQEN